MPILGLDIGEKTIGVALSDALGITAQPVMTIRYRQEAQAFHHLGRLIARTGVLRVVIGLPLNMNGEEGEKAANVRRFVTAFEKFLAKKNRHCEIEFWDERLTTVESERVLIEADVSRGKRKNVIDKLAASLILQGYLESST